MANAITNKLYLAVEKPNAVMLAMQDAYWAALGTVGNNLSNASTPGFKSTMIKMEHVIHKNAAGNKVYYVQPGASFRDVTNGSFHQTGNPLDFCLSGKGYFMVATPNGNFLTRNGQCTTNTEGKLVTAQNEFKILNQTGAEITIPHNVKSILLNSEGVIFADGLKLDKIGVFHVEDEQKLANLGSNLLASDEDTPPANKANYQILQGGIEESNVSSMIEGMRMIEILRLYENAQKLIDQYNRAREKTVSLTVKGG